jgi:hypothetical protein
MTPQQLYNEFISGKSLTELGQMVNLSRQRIGQILKPFRQNLDLRLDRPAKEYISTRTSYSWKSKKQSNIFYTRRQQAKNLGIEWTLRPKDIVWPEKCPIFNITLNYNSNEGRTENSPSLDRIDPTKGYTIDNIKIISWRANRIKNDGTAMEHRLIADYMTSFFESKV